MAQVRQLEDTITEHNEAASSALQVQEDCGMEQLKRLWKEFAATL